MIFQYIESFGKVLFINGLAKVHHENHTLTNGIHKLNTSKWNSGMYILQVATDKGTQHIKVMKK
ncbi:MAG: T9SS type A sorting domain-containing protein [Bacteroidia bacterium]|nr:T9SS type A sorting domain-containing protein [Bacteroidia bacterium]MDG2042579.1 T9SS type A sorting domain-containing protein [Bacteroidia bacterium]